MMISRNMLKKERLKPGEVVLVSKPRHNKLRIPYNPKPFVVDEKKDTMFKRSDGTQTVTRYSALFQLQSYSQAFCTEPRECRKGPRNGPAC